MSSQMRRSPSPSRHSLRSLEQRSEQRSHSERSDQYHSARSEQRHHAERSHKSEQRHHSERSHRSEQRHHKCNCNRNNCHECRPVQIPFPCRKECVVTECKYIYPSLYDLNIANVSRYGIYNGKVAIVPPELACNPCLNVNGTCNPYNPCNPCPVNVCPPPCSPRNCAPRNCVPVNVFVPPPCSPRNCAPVNDCRPPCSPRNCNPCGYCQPCMSGEPCVVVANVSRTVNQYIQGPFCNQNYINPCNNFNPFPNCENAYKLTPSYVNPCEPVKPLYVVNDPCTNPCVNPVGVKNQYYVPYNRYGGFWQQGPFCN